MRSPVGALIWEQWRQVWWTAPLAIGFTACVSVALHLDPDIGWYMDIWHGGSTAAIIATLALAGGLLLFAHSSPADVRAGLPARHRILPVPPFMLAITQFAFRAAFFTILALMLIATAALIDRSYAANILPGTAYATCAISIALACLWTAGRRSAFAAAAVGVGVAIALFFLQDAVTVRHPEAAPVLPSMTFAIGAAIALRGASLRHEIHRTPRRETIGARYLWERRKSFDGPTAAYQWFEVRRKARVIASSGAVFAGYVLVLLGYEVWQHLSLHTLTIEAPNALAGDLGIYAWGFLLLPPVAAFSAGLCIAMLDYRDGTLRSAHVVFTLPMNTDDLVRARSWFGAKAALALCLPCFAASAGLAAAYLRVSSVGKYIPPDFYGSSEYLVAMLLSTIATWGLLWSPTPAVAAVFWLGSLALLLDLFGVRDPGRFLEYAVWAVPVAIAAMACYRALRSRRLERHSLGSVERPMYLLVLIATAVGGWLAMTPRLVYDHELPCAAAAALALALHAMVTQPIWIEHLRHGGAARATRRRVMEV